MEIKIAGRAFGFIATVMIPSVVFAMIGHITPWTGFSIIIVSAAIGLADLAWFAFPSVTWRQKLAPIILGSIGLLMFGFAILWILSERAKASRAFNPPATVEEPNAATAQLKPTPTPGPPSPRPARAVPVNMASVPELTHARIVVTKFAPIPIQQNGQTLFPVNVYIKNIGAIQGEVPVKTWGWKLETGELSSADIDREMKKAVQAAVAGRPISLGARSEMEVGVESFVAMPGVALDQEAMNKISNGEKRLYIFIALTYRDDKLPINQFWVTEYCASLLHGNVIEISGEHNRTWLHK